MLKQVTKDSDVVNIATNENLDKKLWKHQNQKELTKDLEEIERTKNMKKYLTAKEMNDLLFVSHLLEINTNMADNWLERGNLTVEEANLLNMSISYTERFIQSVLCRMPQKEVEKFLKRTIKAKNEPIRIIDKWMQDRVFGSYETEYDIVKIERPQLEKLAFVAIKETCKDCTMSYAKCELYDILEDNLVPRCEIKNNCAYAFVSDQKKKEIEEKKKAKLESKGKISKRKAKKNKNKFDEDTEEVYEYNFKPKVEKAI